MKRWADNVTAILPERLLHAYVDVLLPAAKRRAVHRALMRQPELRETVEVWRKQNADLRRLALMETPGPMPVAMAGVTHRLETRLYRFATLEGLRIAAVIALLLSGVAGTALLAQAQQHSDQFRSDCCRGQSGNHQTDPHKASACRISRAETESRIRRRNC